MEEGKKNKVSIADAGGKGRKMQRKRRTSQSALIFYITPIS
jgi:hypothetical protein